MATSSVNNLALTETDRLQHSSDRESFWESVGRRDQCLPHVLSLPPVMSKQLCWQLHRTLDNGHSLLGMYSQERKGVIDGHYEEG